MAKTTSGEGRGRLLGDGPVSIGEHCDRCPHALPSDQERLLFPLSRSLTLWPEVPTPYKGKASASGSAGDVGCNCIKMTQLRFFSFLKTVKADLTKC